MEYAAFCRQYEQLYGHLVLVTLRDGTTIEGGYYDDFGEDEAILISKIGPEVVIISVDEIKSMALSPRD